MLIAAKSQFSSLLFVEVKLLETEVCPDFFTSIEFFTGTTLDLL
jgi:hypothetical protein